MGQGKGEGWSHLFDKLSLHSISLVGWEYSKHKTNSFLGRGGRSCFSLRNRDPPHFGECKQVRGTCEAWWAKADVSLTHRRLKVQQQVGTLAVWLFLAKRSLSSGHYLQAPFIKVQVCLWYTLGWVPEDTTLCSSPLNTSSFTTSIIVLGLMLWWQLPWRYSCAWLKLIPTILSVICFQLEVCKLCSIKL